MKMHRTSGLGLAVAVVVMLAVAMPALAQRDAGAKMRGEFGKGFRPHTSAAYQRQARDHARILYHYGTTYPELSKETAQEELNEIRQNIVAAQAELAKLGDELAKRQDLTDHVTALKKHYAAAMSHCDMAQKAIDIEQADLSAMCDCCTDAFKELEAAQMEHDQLMKKLGVEPLTEPKKSN